MAKDISPLLGRVLKEIAPRIGARVVLEPKWKIVGQIIYRNGRKRYFRYSSLDLNRMGASEIARDKDYCNFFMKSMGYPTVEGRAFFSPAWARAIGSKHSTDEAYRYVKAIGFPVIVKPNSGSQGVCVAKVYTRKEFYRAIKAVFRCDRVALVQRPVTGRDYRIVVLDKRVISAYERIPLSVIGDGRSTIKGLLEKKQRAFVAARRDTILKPSDHRITQKLVRQGLSLASIPKKGRQVFLLDNANLSTGGDAVDVTDIMHRDFKKVAVRLTADMGLRLCGVDLMIEPSIEEARDTYWVLEINSAPGLDHYVLTGKKQEKIVEKMYLEVLKAMER